MSDLLEPTWMHFLLVNTVLILAPLVIAAVIEVMVGGKANFVVLYFVSAIPFGIVRFLFNAYLLYALVKPMIETSTLGTFGDCLLAVFLIGSLLSSFTGK